MASDRTAQPAMPTTEGILHMQQLLVLIAGIPTYRGERMELEAFVRQGDVVCGLAESEGRSEEEVRRSGPTDSGGPKAPRKRELRAGASMRK